MRALVVFIALGLTSCSKPSSSRELAHDVIRVTNDARLRIDMIGEGKWEALATFVLVDAENTSKQGAYVSLAGDLVDESGTKIGAFKPQSLWVPAGAVRTFALVDQERKPRPTARGAQIFVRGAKTGHPPPAHVDDVKQVPSEDKIVLQGTLKNDAARPGSIVVIASFYGADGRPMTRPFSVLWVDAKGSLPVQFVGPPGSTRGNIYIGDAAY
jgi:hypothetical protein